MEINALIEEEFNQCPETNWLKNVVEQVINTREMGTDVELGLVITGDEQIRYLNRNYRGKDEPTDVLAFSFESDKTLATDSAAFILPPDDVVHLGEVIISCPRAIIQAEEHKHSIWMEIAILIIHGVLHLLGYDHEELEQQKIMAAREREILDRLTLE